MTIFALALGLTIYKRSSDIKVLAATLDLAKSKKGTKKRLKEGYEEGAAEGDTENVKMEGKSEHLTTSGRLTIDLNLFDIQFLFYLWYMFQNSDRFEIVERLHTHLFF